VPIGRGKRAQSDDWPGTAALNEGMPSDLKATGYCAMPAEPHIGAVHFARRQQLTSCDCLSYSPRNLLILKANLEVGRTSIWGQDGETAFLFVSGMAIDADGSPHAYNPSDTGLDNFANGGRPGNWWGS